MDEPCIDGQALRYPTDSSCYRDRCISVPVRRRDQHGKCVAMCSMAIRTSMAVRSVAILMGVVRYMVDNKGVAGVG